MKAYKAEAKTQISQLKKEISGLKAELKAAAQKEAKLLKMFEAKTKAVQAFATKWEKQALKKLTTPVKRKKRVKK